MIRIGTSGWSYDHWFKYFYPENLAKKKAFDYYQKKFDTVELNVSFYRLVPAATYGSWHQKVSSDFLFAVKASRYITHIKRFKNYEQPLERFFETTKGLKNNLGPILFQLHSNFKKDLARLEYFIVGLPSDYYYAFEFRNGSWLSDDVFSALRNRNIALVLSHSPFFPYNETVTAGFVYARLHGPGRLCSSNYSDNDLAIWAEKIKGWSKQGKDVFIYFNNDFKAFAPTNALKLMKMLNITV